MLGTSLSTENGIANFAVQRCGALAVVPYLAEPSHTGLSGDYWALR